MDATRFESLLLVGEEEYQETISNTGSDEDRSTLKRAVSSRGAIEIEATFLICHTLLFCVFFLFFFSVPSSPLQEGPPSP